MYSIHQFMIRLSDFWRRRISARFSGLRADLVQIADPFALLAAFLLLLTFITLLIYRKKRGSASRVFTILFGLGAIVSAATWAFFWVEERNTIISRHPLWSIVCIVLVAFMAILFMCLTRGRKRDTAASAQVPDAISTAGTETAASKTAAGAEGKEQPHGAATVVSAKLKEGTAAAVRAMQDAFAESEKPVPAAPAVEYLPSVPVSGDDMALEHIRSLHDLMKAGWITEAEFAAKRDELLARL